MIKEELDFSNGNMGIKINEHEVVIYQRIFIAYSPILTLTKTQFLLLCDMIPFIDRNILDEKLPRLQTLSSTEN